MLAEERHVWRGTRFEFLKRGTATGDDERQAEFAERFDGNADAFVRLDESADDQEEVFARRLSGLEELAVDWGADHVWCDAVEPLDLFGRVGRLREVAVDAFGGSLVCPAHTGRDGAEADVACRTR